MYDDDDDDDDDLILFRLVSVVDIDIRSTNLAWLTRTKKNKIKNTIKIVKIKTA